MIYAIALFIFIDTMHHKKKFLFLYVIVFLIVLALGWYIYTFFRISSMAAEFDIYPIDKKLWQKEKDVEHAKVLFVRTTTNDFIVTGDSCVENSSESRTLTPEHIWKCKNNLNKYIVMIFLTPSCVQHMTYREKQKTKKVSCLSWLKEVFNTQAKDLSFFHPEDFKRIIFHFRISFLVIGGWKKMKYLFNVKLV